MCSWCVRGVFCWGCLCLLTPLLCPDGTLVHLRARLANVRAVIKHVMENSHLLATLFMPAGAKLVRWVGSAVVPVLLAGFYAACKPVPTFAQGTAAAPPLPVGEYQLIKRLELLKTLHGIASMFFGFCGAGGDGVAENVGWMVLFSTHFARCVCVCLLDNRAERCAGDNAVLTVQWSSRHRGSLQPVAHGACFGTVAVPLPPRSVLVVACCVTSCEPRSPGLMCNPCAVQFVQQHGLASIAVRGTLATLPRGANVTAAPAFGLTVFGWLLHTLSGRVGKRSTTPAPTSPPSKAHPRCGFTWIRVIPSNACIRHHSNPCQSSQCQCQRRGGCRSWGDHESSSSCSPRTDSTTATATATPPAREPAPCSSKHRFCYGCGGDPSCDHASARPHFACNARSSSAALLAACHREAASERGCCACLRACRYTCSSADTNCHANSSNACRRNCFSSSTCDTCSSTTCASSVGSCTCSSCPDNTTHTGGSASVAVHLTSSTRKPASLIFINVGWVRRLRTCCEPPLQNMRYVTTKHGPIVSYSYKLCYEQSTASWKVATCNAEARRL